MWQNLRLLFRPLLSPPANSWRGRALWGVRFLLAGSFLLGSLTWLALVWLAQFPPDLSPWVPAIAHHLSRVSGLTVSLEGMAVRLGEQVSLEGVGVSLRPPGGADTPPLARVGHLHFTLNPWLLFQGISPVVLQLDGVQVTVRRLPDLSWTIGGWRAGNAGPAGGGGGANWWGAGMPLPLVDYAVVFGNTTITLVDEATRWQGEPVTTRIRLPAGRGILRDDRGVQLNLAGEGETRGSVSPLSLSLNGDVGGRWSLLLRAENFRPDAYAAYYRGIQPLDGLNLPMGLDLELKFGAGLPSHAVWRVTAGRGEMAWPGLFRWPIPISRLVGNGVLDEDPQGHWTLGVERFQVDNVHGHAQGRLTLSGLGGETPYLDLSATAGGVSTKQARYYYPAGIMHDDLVAWLDRALVHGTAVDARVVVKGPAREIPFHKSTGETARDAVFRIEGHVRDLVLDYFPGLPPLTGLDTHVTFDRLAMRAEVSGGHLVGSGDVGGTVTIADMLHDPVVEIHATSDGDLGSLWNDVVSAPELRWDRKVGLEGTTLAGLGRLALDIRLPVLRLAESRYVGTLSFADGHVKLPFLEGVFSDLTGTLALDREALSLALLHGVYQGVTLAGGRLQVTGFQEPEESRLLLSLEGRVASNGWSRWLPPAWQGRLLVDGPAPLSLTLERAPRSSRFSWHATLDPTALEIHGPLGWRKESGASGEVNVRGALTTSGAATVEKGRVHLGNLLLQGAGAWQPGGRGGWQLDQFSLGRSQGNLTLVRHDGWQVKGRLTRLDLIPYLPRFHDGAAPGGAGDSTPTPAVGRLPGDTVGEQPPTVLDLTAEEVLLANGEVATGLLLKAAREEAAWTVTQLHMTHGEGAVSRANGAFTWTEQAGLGPYEGQFLVESDDLGALLRGLDLHQGLKGGAGSATLTLAGVVPPGKSLATALSGQGHLLFRKGVIKRMKLLSTLLGLLSLEDLPRLLAADRPDLEGEGFYYKTLQGDFLLNNGLWRTDNLTLEGPSMKIAVSGTLDGPGDHINMLVGMRPLQTLDAVVTTIPLLGRVVTGSRETLLETQFRVRGAIQEPEVTLLKVPSLAPGVIRDLLSLPGRLLRGRPKTEDTGGNAPSTATQEEVTTP